MHVRFELGWFVWNFIKQIFMCMGGSFVASLELRDLELNSIFPQRADVFTVWQWWCQQSVYPFLHLTFSLCLKVAFWLKILSNRNSSQLRETVAHCWMPSCTAISWLLMASWFLYILCFSCLYNCIKFLTSAWSVSTVGNRMPLFLWKQVMVLVHHGS